MRIFLLPLFLFSIFSYNSFASISFSPSSLSTEIVNERLPVALSAFPSNIAKMKVKELENAAGRKLSLKEKIAFFIYKSKIKKNIDASKEGKPHDEGQTAFILGLLSLCCLPFISIASLPLAIVAVVMGKKVLKKDPSDKRAKTGVILGWITIGLIIVAIVALIAIISSFHFV